MSVAASVVTIISVAIFAKTSANSTSYSNCYTTSCPDRYTASYFNRYPRYPTVAAATAAAIRLYTTCTANITISVRTTARTSVRTSARTSVRTSAATSARTSVATTIDNFRLSNTSSASSCCILTRALSSVLLAISAVISVISLYFSTNI